MPLTYYPVALNNAPLPPFQYPGIPNPGAVAVPLTMADLVFASVIDVMEGAPFGAPVNLSWLFDMFESAIDESTGVMQIRQYSQISRSWKRALSETIANAVSLGIALFHEGYDWAIPVPLARNINSLPNWWPWTPIISCSQPTVPLHKLMPDFLLGSTVGGVTSFSSMEVKGQDNPLDTLTFPTYPDKKKQSENIQLLDNVGTVVLLSRKILSVVAVRPNLVTQANRNLKCRWFNHAEIPENVAPGMLTQMMLTQCLLLLSRLFGIMPKKSSTYQESVNLSMFRQLAFLGRLGRTIEIRPMLQEVDGGYVRRRTDQDRSNWRPFISKATFNLFNDFEAALRQTSQWNARWLLTDQLISKFLETHRFVQNREEPMLRIGIGLKLFP